MSKRDRLLLLEDMLESIPKIFKYTKGMSYDEFLEDDKTIDAVVRNFEIIGEASNKIEDDFKTLNPELEWNKLRGFRNRIVHEYFGIDIEIVWTIIQEDLINYLECLEVIIDSET